MNTKNRQTLFSKKFFFLALILLALSLTACGAEGVPTDLDALGEGPTTWIEYPPEGEIFSMGAIPIVVYAADAGGVASIEINIDGQPVPAGQLLSLAGGSSTLVSTEVLWQPPREGEYMITASSGGGASTTLRFCVVNCDGTTTEVEAPTSTPLPIATLPTLAPDEPTRTPSPIPSATLATTNTATNTPVSYSKANVEFWAAPPYLNQGECTTLNWNVTGNFKAVYLEGNTVNASGSDNECPAQSYTYQLHVDEMDNSTSIYEAYVEVYEVVIPTDTPIPADTTGPSINWTGLTWSGCQFYGEAGITDESGVSWAQFHYNKDGEGWNSIWMSGSGDYWQAELGVAVGDGMGTVIPGSIEYYVITADTLGNENESGVSSYNYSSCDG